MVTVKTTRVRPEWVADLRAEYGTDVAIAEKLGVDKSTVGRWLSGEGEATGRFIGAVLLTFPITFDDAFVCVEEIAERRKARVYKRATGRPVAAWSGAQLGPRRVKRPPGGECRAGRSVT